jgi:hypothetical protein
MLGTWDLLGVGLQPFAARARPSGNALLGIATCEASSRARWIRAWLMEPGPELVERTAGDHARPLATRPQGIEALAIECGRVAGKLGARAGIALEGDAPTLAELARDGTFTERRWVVEPFLPFGHVGMLFAGPKVGKSSLLIALIVDLLLGRRPCEGAFETDAPLPADFEILYLTEDAPQLLQLVRRCAGRAAEAVLARIRVISPERSAELRDFDEVTAEVREILAQNTEVRVFVTDTLGAWSRSTEILPEDRVLGGA